MEYIEEMEEIELRTDVYVYEVVMPTNIYGLTVPCEDGYTVYINANATKEQRIEAYKHELRHIDNGDYSQINCGLIEIYAHGQEDTKKEP